MPRMPRLVVPGLPHHVTQRGNRRQQVFFDESDYASYIDLLTALKTQAGVAIWAYCLMPNHVHFVAVPEHAQSLAKLFGIAHHRFARRVNLKHDWQGHLWQERFHSSVMDEDHLLAAVRYIEMNPVRAGICDRAADWNWSSVHAHLGNRLDTLVTGSPMPGLVTDWSRYLEQPESPKLLDNLRSKTRTGRPSGSSCFTEDLEIMTGQALQLRKTGRKRD